MAKPLKLQVENRKITGRKVKSLRRDGILPANIFGKDVKSKSIKLPLADFKKAYSAAGETGILELQIGKTIHPTLIANVAYDPVSGTPIHADFKEINLKEKVSATVPVVLVGESPAEKSGEGTLTQQINEINVTALPTDLLDEFEVEVSGLTKVDQTITAADLKYDKTKLELDIEPDQLIAKIEALLEEEKSEPAPVEGKDGESVEDEKVDAPAEEGSPESSEEQPSDEKSE